MSNTYDPSAINEQFQSSLGRDATDAEHGFFKPYVEGGFLSPYQIGQYAQGTPEAQQTRLQQYGKQFGDTLGQYDQTILGRAADTANAQFADNGRQWSSGQGNSILQAGQNLAMDRNQALAGFYGNGYQGLMSQFGNQSQGMLNRGYQKQDLQQQRDWQLQDYYLQQNDFNNYLRGQNVRNQQSAVTSGLFSLGSAGIGAAGMASMGGGGGGMPPMFPGGAANWNAQR